MDALNSMANLCENARNEISKGDIKRAISVVKDGLGNVFALIEDILDYNEQNEAESDFLESIGNIGHEMIDKLEIDLGRNLDELLAAVESERIGFVNYTASVTKLKAGTKLKSKQVESIMDLYDKLAEERYEKMSKRIFNDFWEINQSEKAELEAKRIPLLEQISDHKKAIVDVPRKTEGYEDMLVMEEKLKSLKEEKKAIKIWKFSDRKGVQAKMDAVNKDIAPIQARIDASIAEIQKEIDDIESKVAEIDHELTRSRTLQELEEISKNNKKQ